MGCEEFKQLLDAYVDGELSPAEMDALRAHAKACEACREELMAAQLLKETLAHMDDDLTVPLQAQAAWRSAVRAEAGKGKRQQTRKWMRACSALAAALVVALGVGLTANKTPEPQMKLKAAPAEMAQSAVVASDGVPDQAVQADSLEDCTRRLKLAVADLEEASAQLEMLAQEYSGSFIAQNVQACIVEIPADYLADFLKAACSLGSELSSEAVAQEGAASRIQIQLVQQ